MVIVTAGTDKAAEEFKGLIASAQWGDDNTDPNASDTALGSAIPATDLAVTSTRSGSSVTYTHTVGSTVANGNTMREFALEYTDGTLLLRAVGADIGKAAGYKLTTLTTINFSRG